MNRNFRAPKTVFLEVTTECNFRCKYCHMWMTDEKLGSLSTHEKIEIIRDFKELNPNGEVVLTGGETMIKEDEFFTLTQECQKLSLVCSANTNASFINPQNYQRILAYGPKYLVISLDSHIETIHDHNRGIKGNHKHILRVISDLLLLRKTHQSSTEIITNSVLLSTNISHLKEFIAFAESLGIDGCIFQMLSRTFYKKKGRDVFFERNFFKDKESAVHSLQSVISTLNTHPIVRTTKQDFEWMILYLANPDFLGEQVCGSHEKNIMIDCYGDIQLCFNMKKINDGRSVGNIRSFKGGIRGVWLDDSLNTIRSKMENCRMNCGMLNCHRRN